MRLLRLALALGLVALLTACQGPDHGRIHGRHYSPAYTSTFCHLVGKITVCTPQYHPATYQLDVWASEDDHGWRYVTRGEYERARVGDYYGEAAP